MAKFLKAGKVGTYHFQFLDVNELTMQLWYWNPSY